MRFALILYFYKDNKVLRQILRLKAGKQNCTNFEFIIHGNVVNDTREVLSMLMTFPELPVYHLQ